MRIQELVAHWEANSKGERTPQTYSINLPLREAAQILALKEMYPDCTEDQILTDLLCYALAELSQAFPYEAGRQVAQDEYGDPIYEDAGLTSCPPFTSFRLSFSAFSFFSPFSFTDFPFFFCTSRTFPIPFFLLPSLSICCSAASSFPKFHVSLLFIYLCLFLTSHSFPPV